MKQSEVIRSKPFFSICIPAYNCEKTILETLESIANQSFVDWELIVYDDGSTDETSAVCRYQRIISFDKYHYHRGAHEGLFETRQRVWALAHGHVVITLDADDCFIGNDALKKLFYVFQRTDCDIVMFNATRDLISMKRFVDYSGMRFLDEDLLDIDCVKRVFCTTYRLNNLAFKAFKRKLVTGFSEKRYLQMAEDRLHSGYLLDKANRIALFDQVIYYYRPNEYSLTRHAFESKFFDDQMYVELKVGELAQLWGIEELSRNRLYASLINHALRRIFEDYSSFFTRKLAYHEIRHSRYYYECVSRACANSSRLDYLVVVKLHLYERYYLLDVFLKLKSGVLALLSRFKKSP